uniref:Uncharacterized protein n=1 Tax=Avena sativa TaxID=4498 RepID=A0ACD5W6Q9_AVESA
MATNVGESTGGSSSVVGNSGTCFQCNICFELPLEPIVTLCGHLFCWPCLDKWLHIHSHSPKCPVCKAVVEEDKLVPLYGSGKVRVDPRSKNNVPSGAADITHRLTGQRLAMSPQADPNRRPLIRMKRKRRRPEDGDTSTGNTRSDHPPPLEVGNQQIPVKGVARSIYVVVSIWDTRPVYSLYKVDYPYHSCSQTPTLKMQRRLHPVASLEMEGGKTFMSMQTRRRKWILVVGGRDSTIIFDTDKEEVIHGPNLLNAKDSPKLVAVEDKVYALSTCPKVRGKQDFEPWFEVLDLSGARVVDGCLVDCSWKEVPSPPCFPCQLTAHEFFHPPMVIVQSYVVAGSYILLSLRSNQHATYAFDTISAKWHKVHGSKSLPFIGRPTAQQHGGIANLYLGESAQGNERWWSRARQGDPAIISAYAIKLGSCEKEDIELSITEFPIKSSQTCNDVTGFHYSSLGMGIFCSLDWKSRVRRSWDDDILKVHFSKKATITLKTYQMEDNSLQEDEPVKKIAISEQPEQAFKIRTKSGGVARAAFLAVFNT